MSLIVGILVVKTLIWALSLGSGTSGGVLAPVFMIGGALGALEAHILPGGDAGLLGADRAGGGRRRRHALAAHRRRLPARAHPRLAALLPLLIAATAAYTVSALLLKRSVLTEKVARRGLHLTREYAVDPLEVLLVDEVMHTDADHRPRPGIPGRAQRARRRAPPVAVPGDGGARPGCWA